MILVILAIFIAAIVVFAYLDFNGGYGSCYDFCAVTSFVFAVITLIATIILAACVISGNKIDEKIQMYSEENAAIESKIEATVQNYLEYEGKTYAGLKTEDGSSITIVAAYPELASSEIVKSQVDLYTANNKQIRNLKEQQIMLSVKKWWLYFGG